MKSGVLLLCQLSQGGDRAGFAACVLSPVGGKWLLHRANPLRSWCWDSLDGCCCLLLGAHRQTTRECGGMPTQHEAPVKRRVLDACAHGVACGATNKQTKGVRAAHTSNAHLFGRTEPPKKLTLNPQAAAPQPTSSVGQRTFSTSNRKTGATPPASPTTHVLLSHLADVSVHVPTTGPTSHTTGRPEEDRPYMFQLLISTAPSPPGAAAAPLLPCFFIVPVTTLICVSSFQRPCFPPLFFPKGPFSHRRALYSLRRALHSDYTRRQHAAIPLCEKLGCARCQKLLLCRGVRDCT